MLSRRRFMFVLGGATTGLWLASTGLVRLERTFVLSLADRCHFCGKDRTIVRALVGTVGRDTTICDECVGLCWDIIAEELGEDIRPAALWLPREEPRAPAPVDDEILAARQLDGAAAGGGDALDALRRALQQNGRAGVDSFRCSFCDAHRRDVRKLVSGPRVLICDSCVGDATALISDVLRA